MTIKRSVDVVVGTFLAIVALPFMVVLAIGCAISLRAWPIFVQRRVGKDGREFRLPKLRTLPKSAPTAVDKYALDGTDIPTFCRLLRRAHIDELPQLFVVPLGRMSLVGPRPEMPTLLARYPSDFAAERARVRPGCTGLWQISVASGMLIYETPEFDLTYIENRGLRLDAWIMYRTLRMWATGRGAIDFADIPHWVCSGSVTAAYDLAPLVDLRDVKVRAPALDPIDLTLMTEADADVG
jgi:lipopolysaccharide/colanic/teichoic acid biosynthesis glycosyltransferase